MADLSIFVKSV